MIRISCIKPERVKELFDDKTVKGIHFHVVHELGLQITLSYDHADELDEDEVEGKVKQFMKQDEIFQGLIVGIEFVD